MRTIGLLGGMGWPSSLEYYRLLNQQVQAKLGGHHSARCILLSVDFAEIERLQVANDWATAGKRLAEEAQRLDDAGIEILLLATNTMHRVADAISSSSRAQFLHIADALGRSLAQRGITKIGLLGTRYTMEGTFYSERLASLHGVTTLIPEPAERDAIHRIIYEELVHNRVEAASRKTYLEIVGHLVGQGVQAVALACTEIGLLLKDGDASVPLLDTAALHCAWAVELALDGPQLR